MPFSYTSVFCKQVNTGCFLISFCLGNSVFPFGDRLVRYADALSELLLCQILHSSLFRNQSSCLAWVHLSSPFPLQHTASVPKEHPFCGEFYGNLTLRPHCYSRYSPFSASQLSERQRFDDPTTAVSPLQNKDG